MAILEPRRSTQDTSQGRMFLTARVTEALLAWWISLASSVSSFNLILKLFGNFRKWELPKVASLKGRWVELLFVETCCY